MSAQVKQQLFRIVRLGFFGALAATPSGQAIAADLHRLASDVHVAILVPVFWQGSAVGLAEVVVRSIVPSTSAEKGAAKAAAKTGTAARLLVWVSNTLAGLAQRFVGTVPPANPPAA